MVVADVFDGARMPDSVAETDSPPGVSHLLRPGGLLGMNLTDLPPLAYSRIQAATLRAAFGDVALVAGAVMLRGRRAGKMAPVAARQGRRPAGAVGGRRPRPGTPSRAGCWYGAALQRLVAGEGARPPTRRADLDPSPGPLLRRTGLIRDDGAHSSKSERGRGKQETANSTGRRAGSRASDYGQAP